MTDDGNLLLDAIHDSRRDDTPRLMYADWLDGIASMEECPACNGSGITKVDFNTVLKIGMLDNRPVDLPPYSSSAKCHRCCGNGRVPDANADYAEFIRLSCELATAQPTKVHRRSILGEHGPLGAVVTHVDWPEDVIAKRIRAHDILTNNKRLSWFDCFGMPVSTVDSVNVRWSSANRSFIDGTIRSGFIDSLTLSASDFWEYFDRAYYKPNWTTDKCTDCRGHGRHADHSEAECVKCGGVTGTGRCGTGIAGFRVRPTTAQPITKVTITGFADYDAYELRLQWYMRFKTVIATNKGDTDFLRELYPDVTFDVRYAEPSAVDDVPDYDYDDFADTAG